MRRVLLDYGTSETQWWLLFLSLFIILLGIGLIMVVTKGAINLSRNKLDTCIHVSWGLIVVGGITGVLTLFNASENDTKYNHAIQNWKSERGYYVESYGKIKDLKGETTISVETKNLKVVEKEVDHVIQGCDFDVYAELSSGDVWICTQSDK